MMAFTVLIMSSMRDWEGGGVREKGNREWGGGGTDEGGVAEVFG